MFYGDCVKICEDFALNFGDKRTGCCFTTAHPFTLPFSPKNFFTKNNMTVISHPAYFSLLGDCVKICEDFALNFGDKRTGCCFTTAHPFTLTFSPKNFFTKNNMTVISHPAYFSLLP
jgi:NAD-dependent dihydropyrimidine dehydrogenase PreA subunit